MKTLLMDIYNPQAIPMALDILNQGGVVAFPTDTVYGLGALAFDDKAVEKITSTKGRTAEKAIPILIGSVNQLSMVTINLDKRTEMLARQFWPGPLTIILPRHPSIPEAVTPYPTIGIRIPNLSVIIDLLIRTGPMAVSSANLTGMSSSATAKGILEQLDGKIPLILDGGTTPGGIASTVVDFTGESPKILREGPISLEEILQALG